jgi:hypothetical protein
MSPPVDKLPIWITKRAARGSDHSVDRFFTKKFIKGRRVFARSLTSIRKGKNAHRDDLVAARDGYFVAGFNRVGRLGDSAVEGNSACVTKFLGERATRTEATCFEEEIEAHAISFKFQV